MQIKKAARRLMSRIFGGKPASSPSSAGSLPFHEQRYTDGIRYFEAGDLDHAQEAFSDFLQYTYQDRIIDPKVRPYGLVNVRWYLQFERAFRKLLTDKFEQWEGHKQPYPRFLTFLDETKPPSVSAQGKRILFVIPHYIMNSKRFIEADFR